MASEYGFGKYRFKVQVWAIFSAAVIGSVGFGLVFPFIAIYLADSMQLEEWLVGIVMMSYMSTGTFFMLFGGAWADKFGRKKIMIVSLVGEAILITLYAFASEFWGFLAIALAEGAIGSLYPPAANAMIADLVPSERRPHAFTLIRIAFNSGAALGPMVGSVLIITVGLRNMFLFSGVAVFFAAVAIILKTTETLNVKKGEEFKYQDLKVAMRDRAFVLYCIFSGVTWFIYAQTISALPVYATTDLGIPTELYALIFATNAGMVVALQIPVTWGAIKVRRTTALSVGQLLMAVGMGLVFLVTNFIGLVIAMVIFTAGELVQAAVYSTLVADMSPKKLRGTYMGFSGLAIGIGDALGMFTGLALLSVLPARECVWLIVMLMGIPVALGYYMMKKMISNDVDTGTCKEPIEEPMVDPTIPH